MQLFGIDSDRGYTLFSPGKKNPGNNGIISTGIDTGTFHNNAPNSSYKRVIYTLYVRAYYLYICPYA